jgi:hypothetical protein
MHAHEYADAPGSARAPRIPRYRHQARFVTDWREHCRPIDRNMRAKIVFLAEALERRTKKAGRRNGLLGNIGLTVLRALMFGFLNRSTGLLCPSYRAIADKTGLCRESVREALARLERAGIIKTLRRLVRQWVERVSPITGQPERFVATTQGTNLYSLHAPGAWAEHLPLPAGSRTPFPPVRQLSLLERGALTWANRLSLNPSPSDREKPPAPGAQKLRYPLGLG